jgi:GTP cyclohydrolase II
MTQDFKPHVPTLEQVIKVMTIKYYQDSSHGWIAVKRSVLAGLGLLDQISAYSYQSKTGQTVYLEEDRDASLVLKQLQEKGMVYQIESIDAGDRSPIRSYERYSK